jgi:hypothetical protein
MFRLEKKKNLSRVPSNNNLKEPTEIENLNKIISNLKNENIDLKKENELIKVENMDKNLTISKLKSEKFLLYNELNELINSLKTVDIKLLNKFYKNFSSSSTTKLNKGYMTSSLGIKYNIMSVQNQLSYLLHSDLVTSKAYTEYVSKARETMSKAKAEEDNVHIMINNNDLKVIDNNEENFIDLDKYLLIVKKFESEFEKICDRNLRREDYRNKY